MSRPLWLTCFVLAACEPISLGDKTDTGIDDADDVAQLCAESTPKDVKVPVSFPETTETCQWETDGNLAAADATYTARAEETEVLEMPESAVICDVTYDFQVDPENIQVMHYDDQFTLNFLDVVIAASNHQIPDLLPNEDDLVLWDWASVAGTEIDWNDTDPWCLGEDEGLSSCTIPGTDVDGEMLLEYDEALTAELSYRAVEQGRVDFTFVTIGDNDPQSDCTHKGFEFQVSLSYVER